MSRYLDIGVGHLDVLDQHVVETFLMYSYFNNH